MSSLRNDYAARPVIGVCARTAPVTVQGLDTTVSLALQAHVDMLATAGCAPLLVPLLPGAEEFVPQLDGLLLPGGPDLDPELYGQPRHPRTRCGSPGADRVELALLRAALDADRPVLAICRGMQVLNVLSGGTLHQHLPEAVNHDGHCPQTATFTLGSNHLHIQPDSLAAAAFGADVPTVACHHHQGVDRVGAGLTVTARAADGVVEAIESTGHAFVLGVQWEAGQYSDTRLHRALADAAGRARQRPLTPGESDGIADEQPVSGRTRRAAAPTRAR
ncbi:gamma-glutamyl-gamma-aminobutyrate hydrolase family protein [Salinispora cortesiana]|uniref:gamma-glutamyl-gamma-aminobutyrate hydrolase family protein n=1 Tax=Salinispora cortesiana TaxID=1305843 RepID=UPI00047177A2|nr:gamma-glutamyl-gamma-aminobutyrate hydrolase family protein [Salinispora cortesiana]